MPEPFPANRSINLSPYPYPDPAGHPFQIRTASFTGVIFWWGYGEREQTASFTAGMGHTAYSCNTPYGI